MRVISLPQTTSPRVHRIPEKIWNLTPVPIATGLPERQYVPDEGEQEASQRSESVHIHRLRVHQRSVPLLSFGRRFCLIILLDTNVEFNIAFPTSTAGARLVVLHFMVLCPMTDVTLTSREKAQAANIFHALDINHDKKISRTEMSDLLHAVSDWAQDNSNHNLYLAVDRSVYTSYSDTNKDGYVSYKEFLAGLLAS